MKTILFLLIPFFLEAQTYQLDSAIYTSPNEIFKQRYVYESPRDFTIYQETLDHNGDLSFDYQDYKDSLLIKWTILRDDGDTLFWKYTYDDLRRLVSELDYKQDTLVSSDVFTYFQDTDLVQSRNSYSLKNNEIITQSIELSEYNDQARITNHKYTLIRKNEIYKSGESNFTYPDEMTSYSLNYYRDGLEPFDTSLTKTITYANQYYGDTLRESYDFYILSPDSIVMNSYNSISYSWGNYNRFEDAGTWNKSSGSVSGNYQDYESTAEGFSFSTYEDMIVDSAPEHESADLLYAGHKFSTGTVTLNDAGLPLLEKIHWIASHFDFQNEYFYSLINEVEDILPVHKTSQACLIISQLSPAVLYYDYSGKMVTHPIPNQYLIEKSKYGPVRVLFIGE